MKRNDDTSWIEENGLKCAWRWSLLAISGMVAMVLVSAVLQVLEGRGIAGALFVIPWVVTVSLGVPGAYKRGVIDERRRVLASND